MKMKNMKKLLVLVLVIAAVMAIGITAFADGEGEGGGGSATPTGTITIENAMVGETYNVYKIFDAIVGENGEIVYTYDGTLETNNYFEKNASGNIVAQDAAKDDNGNLTAAAIEFLGTLKGTAVASPEATTGTIELDNMAYGYYYIERNTDTGKGTETVVMIDSTNPDVTVYDKNNGPYWDNTLVPEDPKDQNPGKVIVEENGNRVKANSANYGDTVTFDIGVVATNYVGEDEISYYFINDKLGAGFDYVMEEKEKEEDPDVVAIESITVGDTEISDYTLVMNGDHGFQITIPWANIEEDGTEITSISPKYENAPVEIHVQYKATVNKNAVIGGDGNPNTANFTYQTNKVGDEGYPGDDGGTPDDPSDDTPPTDPGDPGTPGTPGDDGGTPDDPSDDTPPTTGTPGTEPFTKDKEKTTITYVYALGIQKVDGEGSPLNGAKFEIAGVQATGAAGAYEYCAEGTEGAVSEFETDANGMLVIKGVDAGDYVVTETQAPDGYNKMAESKTISATMTEKCTTTTVATLYFNADGEKITKADFDNLIAELKASGEWTSEEDPTAADVDVVVTDYTTDVNVFGIEVINNKGTELPSTGGVGTTIFYAVGALLILAAGVLLITKKRMSVEA